MRLIIEFIVRTLSSALSATLSGIAVEKWKQRKRKPRKRKRRKS